MKIGAVQIHRSRILPVLGYRSIRTAAGRGGAIEHCIPFGLICVGRDHADQIALRVGRVSFAEVPARDLQICETALKAG
jgi:hypothetical protein